MNPYFSDARPAPGWADLTAQWGRTGEVPPEPPGGYPPSNPPPWITDPQKPSGAIVWLLGALLVAGLIVCGFLVQRLNVLPAQVPVIGQDSGYAACAAIAGGQKPFEASGSDKPMTQGEYRQARSVFADSRYEAVRINGVKLIDLAWQVQGLGEDPGMGALVYVGGMADAYAGLAGGCADLGFTLPKITN